MLLSNCQRSSEMPTCCPVVKPHFDIFFVVCWYVHQRFMLYSAFQGDVCCCPVVEHSIEMPFDMFIKDLCCTQLSKEMYVVPVVECPFEMPFDMFIQNLCYTQFSKEMYVDVQLSNVLLRCLLICSSKIYVVIRFPRRCMLLSSWRTCFWDAFWYVHPRFML